MFHLLFDFYSIRSYQEKNTTPTWKTQSKRPVGDNIYIVNQNPSQNTAALETGNPKRHLVNYSKMNTGRMDSFFHFTLYSILLLKFKYLHNASGNDEQVLSEMSNQLEYVWCKA